MTVTNSQSGTNVHEIADGIFRISTPVPPEAMPGGFTFNQILVRDEAPLLFHTGPRRMFPLVREAVAHVLGEASRLRYLSFSHVEADECGSLDLWLKEAPAAQTVCSQVAVMVQMSDLLDAPARGLADGEELVLGRHKVRWLDAPHVPHNWECGYLFETTTRTLFAGDLFTQPGHTPPPLTEGDVLGPSLAMWKGMPDSIALDARARGILDKLARTEPATLALMHGSSFHGNGAALLHQLASALGL